MLGYHRALTYQGQRADMAPNIVRLFWTVYYIDKNMALLLGRASCIQDYDIDVPYPLSSEDPTKQAWDECFIVYLRLGRVQGQIYDRVYSVAALKLSPEHRAQNIAELAQELHQWRHRMYQVSKQNQFGFNSLAPLKTLEIDWSQVSEPGFMEVSKPTWDIMYYSLLTALLRGSSTATTSLSPEITSECFKAARAALQSHLLAFPKYQESNVVTTRDYANW